MRYLLTIAVVFAATAASAEPAAQAPHPSERISYADLDLRTAAGQKTLARRVRAAADRVCGVADQPTELAAWADAVTCKRHTVEQTMARLAVKPTITFASR